jgi:hypothetical protein
MYKITIQNGTMCDAVRFAAKRQSNGACRETIMKSPGLLLINQPVAVSNGEAVFLVAPDGDNVVITTDHEDVAVAWVYKVYNEFTM